MKKYLVVGITLILPIFILAISLTDYKEAETYFKEAYVNGSMSAAAGNQDQASYNGSALINYKTNYNSLPFAWSLQTTGSSNFGRGATDGDESKIGYDMTAHSNADKYFTDKVFGYGSMDFGYRKAIDADNADDVFAKTGFGAGYGRVFDATVLAKAMRVVDDLASYGLINGKVSDSAYLELSKIIDKEIEFQSKYGLVEYKKYWYEAMEKVLNEDGILQGGKLGALGIVRIQEVLLEERISPRRHGWNIRGGVGYWLSNYDGSENDPSLDVTFEYALPYTYRLQIIELLNFSTILGEETDQNITNNLSVTFELTNKIDWENSWVLSVLVPGNENAENVINNTLSSVYRYYISNQMSANLSLSMNKFEDNIDDNGNEDITTNFQFGLQYRLK